ncbi:hypothetical protein Ahy_A10g046882 isoform B [Arachis hypogaea]|uniref:TF-B3 domain-containing protein n=1 Tax=Arachis hypogaea TaxID=3818 RepID=A0A445B0V0_ARAHY|nr:hypothetical protein Ahy_A10g046882 isoform B [Arachis hypogaea]
MASSSRQQNKHSPSFSTSTGTSFFKIILRKALQNENFKLTKKFTTQYGSVVSNPLYLKPRDGIEWKVYWTKHDGAILFKKGWKEFVAYYSLDHGHLLWFEYNIGTSYIEVRIYDMSCHEIKYPANDQIKEQSPCRGQQPVKRPKEPKIIDVDSSPNTQNMRLNEGQQKKRLNEPRSGRVRSQPRKKMRALVSSASKSRQLEDDTQIRNVERSLNSHDIKSNEKNYEMPVSVNRDSNGKRNRRRKGSESPVMPCLTRLESLKEAKKFKWEKPSFIIKITQRSQTRAPCYFSTKFFRKYFENNPQNANIRFGKKLFPVKLIYRPSSCVAFISAGWNLFARASKLQAGDVCLFKLINRKDPNLSAIFYRKYFKKNQQDVKLQFGKESWPATIIYNPSSKNSFISAGWSSFARASKLEVGDVCVFELINGKDLFDVHICRAQC